MNQFLDSVYSGHFGYDEIKPNIIIPYTYRGNQKFCSTWVFASHFEKGGYVGLPEKLIAFEGFLKGYLMTHVEVRLWNEINIHNDDLYKTKFVYGAETVVKMDDVRAIFKYTYDIKQWLAHGLINKIDCGIVRILSETEILLPFVVKEGQRYVPMDISYVPEILNISTILTGIHVMYMRFVFYVLKKEPENMGFDIKCVLLDEVVAYYKKNKEFEYMEDYWPSVQGADKPVRTPKNALFQMCLNINLILIRYENLGGISIKTCIQWRTAKKTTMKSGCLVIS